MIAYLDTNVVAWLGAGKTSRISKGAQKLLRTADLILSPIVVLELEYMYEIGRTKMNSGDVRRKVEHEIGIRLCDLPFATITSVALDEKWTRDPFDRFIVANAKANGFAPLISSDETIARHYPRTVW